LYGWKEAGSRYEKTIDQHKFIAKSPGYRAIFWNIPKLVAAGEFFGRRQWLEKMFEVILHKSLLKPGPLSGSYLMKWQVYSNSLQETPSITYNRIYTQ
jgi:hypothetical protein